MNIDYIIFFKKLDFAILTPYNDEIKRGQRCRVQSLPFSFLLQELHKQLYEAMGLLKYLMLLRNKKQKDVNEGKWIGVGGRMEPGESPEDCICREVLEETGLTITEYRLRGVLTFSSEGWEDEYIFVFTSDKYTGDLKECDEGELRWIDKTEIMNLNLWEGDRIFLKNLLNDDPFFSMRLSYKGDHLTDHVEHFY